MARRCRGEPGDGPATSRGVRSEQRSPAKIEPYAFIRYDDPADAFRPYDPRFPAVAALVAALIEAEPPGMTVERVGSTAVPGCDGKGVADQMLLTPPAQLARTRAVVEALGFRRVDALDAYPESRPVMLGSIRHEEERFRLHVHLIAPDPEEAERRRRFRDRLRADPALVAEYVAGAGAYNDGEDAGHRQDSRDRGVSAAVTLPLERSRRTH